MCFNVQSNLPEFKLVYNLRYKNKRHLQKCKFDLEFYNVNYTLIEMLGSTPSTIFQISPPAVKLFSKLSRKVNKQASFPHHFHEIDDGVLLF